MSEVGGTLAVLSQTLDVRVLNISASGCLLQMDSRVEPGTSCYLRVRVGEEVFDDDVRITRCLSLEGAGSMHHIGAEFLWAAPPGPHSLRRLIGNNNGRVALR